MRQLSISHIEWVEEGEELTAILHIENGETGMGILLEGVTQLDLSFAGGELGEIPYLQFILRSGNGEVALLISEKDWEPFLNEPDFLLLDYGKGQFKMRFLPSLFLRFIDEQIERVNRGEDSLFLREIIHVFAVEE